MPLTTVTHWWELNDSRGTQFNSIKRLLNLRNRIKERGLLVSPSSPSIGDRYLTGTDYISSLQVYDNYQAPTWTDETADAQSPATGDTSPLTPTPQTNDAFYIGYSNKFTTARVTYSTAGVGNYSFTWAYYNGSAWYPVVVDDPTDHFRNTAGSYDIRFTAPDDWTSTSVNGKSAYYIRATVTVTTITTNPLLDYIQTNGWIGATVGTEQIAEFVYDELSETNKWDYWADFHEEMVLYIEDEDRYVQWNGSGWDAPTLPYQAYTLDLDGAVITDYSKPLHVPVVIDNTTHAGQTWYKVFRWKAKSSYQGVVISGKLYSGESSRYDQNLWEYEISYSGGSSATIVSNADFNYVVIKTHTSYDNAIVCYKETNPDADGFDTYSIYVTLPAQHDGAIGLFTVALSGVNMELKVWSTGESQQTSSPVGTEQTFSEITMGGGNEDPINLSSSPSDPGATSSVNIGLGTSGSFRIYTDSGYGDLGPQNSSWFHFETDRAAFYFNKDVQSAEGFKVYNTGALITKFTDDFPTEEADEVSTTRRMRQFVAFRKDYMANLAVLERITFQGSPLLDSSGEGLGAQVAGNYAVWCTTLYQDAGGSFAQGNVTKEYIYVAGASSIIVNASHMDRCTAAYPDTGILVAAYSSTKTLLEYICYRMNVHDAGTTCTYGSNITLISIEDVNSTFRKFQRDIKSDLDTYASGWAYVRIGHFSVAQSNGGATCSYLHRISIYCT